MSPPFTRPAAIKRADKLLAFAFEPHARRLDQLHQISLLFDALNLGLLDHAKLAFPEILSRGWREFYLAAGYTHYLYAGKQCG